MGVRLIGASEVIRTSVPATLDPVALAVTRLGGETALLFGLALLYWIGPRRAAATVVSYGLVGLASVLALKAWFALPRPPAGTAVYAAEGFGFPSGHAVAAVVVYGGLALECDWLDEPPKAAAAGTLVAAIGLSRVVLGVHYLGDVLVGFAVGALLVAGTRRVTDGDPARGFAVGAVVAVLAVAVTGADPRAVGALGACVGGVLGSRVIDEGAALDSLAERAALVVVGLAFVLAVELLEGAIAGVLVGAAVDDVVLVAGVLALPAGLVRVGVSARLERVGVLDALDR